jgi:predicted thioesterase
LISFQVEARDEQELIARGLHQLRVIKVERFTERVRRKNPKRKR